MIKALASAGQYTPEALAEAAAQMRLPLRRRAIEIASVLGAVLPPIAADYVAKNDDPGNAARRASRLREALVRLGPAFVKVGQALSSRPDLVPPSYIAELGKLQDDTPRFSSDIAFRILEEELGVPPTSIFKDISASPVAAACLGHHDFPCVSGGLGGLGTSLTELSGLSNA